MIESTIDANLPFFRFEISVVYSKSSLRISHSSSLVGIIPLSKRETWLWLHPNWSARSIWVIFLFLLNNFIWFFSINTSWASLPCKGTYYLRVMRYATIRIFLNHLKYAWFCPWSVFVSIANLTETRARILWINDNDLWVSALGRN